MSGSAPFDRVGFFPSFPVPMPAPTTDVSASPTLALCFNEEWLPFIVGALTCLMRAETYTGTMEEILDAVSNAMTLPALIGDCESMRTWRQDGCHLYTTLNGIETLIYNGQECIDANILDGTLQKANSGYIGNIGYDDCHTYTVKLTVIENWISPNVVSTGDTILLSNWQGGATDAGMLATTWTCPSGTAYTLGACANTARPPTIYGTDPLQTAPHLAVIAQIGSAYYDVWNSASGITPATFTVPAGIVNEPVRLLMNIGAAVSLVAAGEMWGEVTICNKQQWCYEFDFSVSDGGWTPVGGNEATYVTDTYWDGVDIVLGTQRHICQIQKTFTSTTLTRVQMTYDRTGSGTQNPGVNGVLIANLAVPMNTAVDGTAQVVEWVGGAAFTTLYADVQSSHESYGGVARIRSIRVKGLGTCPFGTPNC